MNLDLINDESLKLSTSRLNISLMSADNFEEFRLLQTDKELMKDIGAILSEQEIIDKFNDRIRAWTKDEGHWLTLAMHCNSTNEFIGSIGFNIKSIDYQSAEIGYLTLSKFQGKGYITEAGRSLIDFLFSTVKVRKIVAYCTTRNSGSWRVMEKLDLKREGLLKSDVCIGNTWFDSYVYGYVNPYL